MHNHDAMFIAGVAFEGCPRAHSGPSKDDRAWLQAYIGWLAGRPQEEHGLASKIAYVLRFAGIGGRVTMKPMCDTYENKRAYSAAMDVMNAMEDAHLVGHALGDGGWEFWAVAPKASNPALGAPYDMRAPKRAVDPYTGVPRDPYDEVAAQLRAGLNSIIEDLDRGPAERARFAAPPADKGPVLVAAAWRGLNPSLGRNPAQGVLHAELLEVGAALMTVVFVRLSWADALDLLVERASDGRAVRLSYGPNRVGYRLSRTLKRDGVWTKPEDVPTQEDLVTRAAAYLRPAGV